MNADARAFASALDRTVRREIYYRQTLARAARVGYRRATRVNVIVLVTFATLLGLVALIA